MADNDWKERLAQTVLLAGNGLSWGLGGKLVPGAQKNLAEARQELGLTGAATETAGQFAGAAGLTKLALKGVPAAWRAVKAAPAVIEATPAAALRGARAIGLARGATRAEIGARLGVEMPTVLGRAAAAATGAAKAHPIASTLAAIGLPVAVSANYASGEYDSPSTTVKSPATTKPATTRAQAKPRDTGVRDKVADDLAGQIMSGLQSVDGQPPTFESMASQLAASQGGKISLNQLSSLGEIARSIATKPVKPVDPTITGAETLMQSYQERLQRGLADPDPQVQQRAMDDYEEKVLQLRKTRFIDPYGVAGYSGEE